MSKDVSNQTVFVLAILAILISILGVASVFFETTDYQIMNEETQTGSSTGQITLDINNPKESNTSGKIILNISNNTE